MDGFLRPPAEVLPESAMVPPQNLVSPPPNQFTHRVRARTPFFYGAGAEGAPPDGEFAEGTRVVLLVREAEGRCRVVSEQGVYAQTQAAALEPL